MSEEGKIRRLVVLLVISLVLVLGGGLLASAAQTAGGAVKIQDVRFTGSNGAQMSALLYIPAGVTAENPAPGILAVHGYINSRETQDGFAIEFARRGYVVLALDQTGHGYSDPPAFARGFGGPDGLRYLRSLDIVDTDNIGMEGHSMGGWTILAAAAVAPDDYKAMVLEGSSTGEPFAAPGTADWPRNVAVVFSEWDEFSLLMWGVETPPAMVDGEKLKTLFNTTDTVEIGRLYGSIEDGTARQLYMPRGTHPNDHISTEAIGYAIEWMQKTLDGGNGLPPSDQIWYWKEIGTFIALIGGVLFLFPFGGLLLRTGFFRDLRAPVPDAKPATGVMWWIAAALTIFIPVLTYFWLQNRGAEWFPTGSFWPQQITTGIMTWAVGNGLITLILFLVWHFQTNRRAGATAENYGLTWDGRLRLGMILKSLLLAICVTLGFYVLLALSDWAFKTDFRLWVLAFKPPSFFQFQVSLAYLIPFGFFFLMASIALNGQLRRARADGTPQPMWRAMLLNVALMAVGILILLLIQYIPVISSGRPLPLAEPLLTIVAFQFVPLLAIVALILTYFFHKTGRVYTGAFIAALLITIYIVAGQATQYGF
ncbi:MAG: alpha/beta fold hydrolase [Anaerolineae bacterium]|nr:alpha/beta fold hydrolase [Anaerolineae bacterium]